MNGLLLQFAVVSVCLSVILLLFWVGLVVLFAYLFEKDGDETTM